MDILKKETTEGAVELGPLERIEAEEKVGRDLDEVLATMRRTGISDPMFATYAASARQLGEKYGAMRAKRLADAEHDKRLLGEGAEWRDYVRSLGVTPTAPYGAPLAKEGPPSADAWGDDPVAFDRRVHGHIDAATKERGRLIAEVKPVPGGDAFAMPEGEWRDRLAGLGAGETLSRSAIEHVDAQAKVTRERQAAQVQEQTLAELQKVSAGISALAEQAAASDPEKSGNALLRWAKARAAKAARAKASG